MNLPRVALVLAMTLALLPACKPGADDAASQTGPRPQTNPAPVPDRSEPAYEATLIGTEELNRRLKQGEAMHVVDVRGKESFAAEHIEGAVSMPWAELETRQKELPKDKPIVLYCA